MSEVLLLGATLLHTRYGHWRPPSGKFLIRWVHDNYRGYPGLAEELLAMRQRALEDQHTIYDQQRIQWLAQGRLGGLDIYQQCLSIMSVSREEIIEDVEEWFAYHGIDITASFADALFASVSAD